MPHGTDRAAAQPRLTASLRGGLWMVAACFCFAAMTGIIKSVSAELHAFEVAFFRNFFGLLFMAPWLFRAGLGALKTDRLGLYAVRALVGLGAMLLWFWAITAMPLAEATALSFTAPLFATVLAVPILRETVRARRWTATVIGFVGAMIILRPGVQDFSLAALSALGAAALIAATTIMIKMLSRTESTNAIVTYMVLMMAPASLVPALFVWVTPSWETLAWLVGLAAFATVAHLCLTNAFRAADASAVMPFDFSRLIFAALIGYFAFGESSDIWTWVGAAVIAVTAVYIAHREARLERTSGAATATGGAHDGR